MGTLDGDTAAGDIDMYYFAVQVGEDDAEASTNFTLRRIGGVHELAYVIGVADGHAAYTCQYCLELVAIPSLGSPGDVGYYAPGPFGACSLAPEVDMGRQEVDVVDIRAGARHSLPAQGRVGQSCISADPWFYSSLAS